MADLVKPSRAAAAQMKGSRSSDVRTEDLARTAVDGEGKASNSDELSGACDVDQLRQVYMAQQRVQLLEEVLVALHRTGFCAVLGTTQLTRGP